MNLHSKLISLALCFASLVLFSCLENKDEQVSTDEQKEQNEKNNKILELEAELEVLRWENARLSLKVRSVNGASLVRDKRTNLWHFDVERTPYTGNATENFKNGKPRAEASFFNGKKDGVARYWFENGNLQSEEQWFAGKKEGIFREWMESGQLSKADRYKAGELIEVLKK
jgi:hypothetical protein